jgi:hypothetical protein
MPDVPLAAGWIGFATTSELVSRTPVDTAAPTRRKYLIILSPKQREIRGRDTRT